jgi:membrane-associated phospholipid phosphatase
MAFIVVLLLLLVSYREALTFLAVTLLLTLLVELLKRVLFPEFIRPVSYFGTSALHLVSGYDPPMLHTFPSGHAVTAFSTGLFLSFLVRRNVVKFVLFLVALMIGYSRIYLSAHFPFDVVFGSFLAVVVTTLVFYLSRKISNSWIDKRIQLVKSAK